MNRKTKVVFVSAMAMAFWTLGCDMDGKSATIRISHARPAEREVPQKIRQLAVNEFTSEDSGSGKWGQVASDKLSGMLEELNGKTHRYTLVDRMGLKKILDERDLQTAFGNPDAAAAHAGKLKSVDAIIYGDVKATHEEKQASKMGFDLATQRPKTTYYTKLYCQVIVKFTMVDVANGATLATLSATENFDSDKDSKQSTFAKLLGQDSANSTNEVLGALVDRTVRKFVGYVSPHEESFDVKLAKVASKAARRGNTLAGSGDYDAALEQYAAGIDEQPDDDGAVFNAGLMYEAKGDFANAAKYYKRALKLKDSAQYAQALARVHGAKE